MIDPKGIRNLSFDDPKFQLYKEIKNVQKILQEHTGMTVELSSFILSETKFEALISNPSNAPRELEERNLLFMEEDCEMLIFPSFSREYWREVLIHANYFSSEDIKACLVSAISGGRGENLSSAWFYEV